jgi:DNA-binding response OmpR family regulator
MSGNSLALPLLSVAQRLGATEVLQKPFLPEELLEAIKHVLRPKRRRTVKK